jgi:hypothetical protein
MIEENDSRLHHLAGRAVRAVTRFGREWAAKLFDRAGNQAGARRIISARQFAEFLRDPAPSVQKRIAYGWSRTAPYRPYSPDEPKLFYAAVEGPPTNVKPLLECVRTAIPWQHAKAADGGRGVWRQTRAISNYAKSAQEVHYSGQVRGFQAKSTVSTGAGDAREIELEAFAFYNTVAADASMHHAVLCLAFNQNPSSGRWLWRESEERVSQAVTAIAIKLDERFPTLREVILLQGGWRFVDFDIPYYGAELLRRQVTANALDPSGHP